MSLPPVPGQQITGKTGVLLAPWLSWFNSLYSFLTQTVAGTTGGRPTTNLYIGRSYYDTTLNIPIWLKTVSPVVWVNSSGAPV